jgi:hypothetical protein
MKVYIAGPMRGIRDFNFPAFDEAADRLRAEGHEVFNPADRDRAVHGPNVNKSETGDLSDPNVVASGFDLRSALGADMEWICRDADAIYLLPGWVNSKGATAERATALALGLEVWGAPA